METQTISIEGHIQALLVLQIMRLLQPNFQRSNLFVQTLFGFLRTRSRIEKRVY